MDIRIEFRELSAKFEKNDAELHPPSSTLQRNAYFKTKFVDEVREAIKNFESLYGKLENKFDQEDRVTSSIGIPHLHRKAYKEHVLKKLVVF